MELLNPEVRELLRQFELQARTIVSGLRCGLHRSRRKGSGADFLYHRGYALGDPIKHLDWKVYGRTERHYTKVFLEDSSLRLWALVDYSGSMEAEPETQWQAERQVALIPKWEQAARLGLALCCLAINQQDQAGLVVAGEPLRWWAPASSSRHLSLLAHGLATTSRRGAGDLAPALKLIEERAGSGGSLIAVASDLSFHPEPVRKALANLRARGHEVVLFHLATPLERGLDLNRWVDFRCAEAPAVRRRVDVTLLRELYRREVESFVAEWREFCNRQRIDYVPVGTDDGLTDILNQYLRRREMEG